MYRQIDELDDILIDPSFSMDENNNNNNNNNYNGPPTTATELTENNDDTYGGGDEQFEDYTEDFDSPVKKQAASVLLSEGEESVTLEDSFVDANPANMYKNKPTAVNPSENVASRSSFSLGNTNNNNNSSGNASSNSLQQLFPVMENENDNVNDAQPNHSESPKVMMEHAKVPSPHRLLDNSSSNINNNNDNDENDDPDSLQYIRNRRHGVVEEQLRKLKQFEPLLHHEEVARQQRASLEASKQYSHSFADNTNKPVNSSSGAVKKTSFVTPSSQLQDIHTLPAPPQSAVVQPSYLNYSASSSSNALHEGEGVTFHRTFHQNAPPLADNWQSLATKSAILQSVSKPPTDADAMHRAVWELIATSKRAVSHTNNDNVCDRYENIASELQQLIEMERRKQSQSTAMKAAEQQKALLAILAAKSEPATYHYNQQVVLLSEYLRNRHSELDSTLGHAIFLIDSQSRTTGCNDTVQSRTTACNDKELRESVNSLYSHGGGGDVVSNAKRSGHFVHRYNHSLVTVCTISMHHGKNSFKKEPKVIFICGPQTIPPLNTGSKYKTNHRNASNVSSIILQLFNANGNVNNQYDPDNIEFNQQIEILYHSIFPRQDNALTTADIQQLIALQSKSKDNKKESTAAIGRYEQLLAEIEELIRLQKNQQVNEDRAIDKLFYISQKTKPKRQPNNNNNNNIDVRRSVASRDTGRRYCEVRNAKDLNNTKNSTDNNKPPFYTSSYYSNHHTYQPNERRSLGASINTRQSGGFNATPRMSVEPNLNRSSKSLHRSMKGNANYAVNPSESINLLLEGQPLNENGNNKDYVKVDRDDYYRYLLTRLQVTQPDITLSCDKIYTNFLSDMIDVCKRRSHECSSSQELAMHRALSSYVAESFAAESIDKIRSGMVKSALDMQNIENSSDY